MKEKKEVIKEKDVKPKPGDIVSEPNTVLHRIYLGEKGGWFTTDDDFKAIVLSKLIKIEHLAE